MSQVIYCNINMFNKNASIVLNGEEIGVVDINSITEVVPQICYDHEVDKIHFLGNEKFINGIVDEFRAITYTNKFNIKIEVN